MPDYEFYPEIYVSSTFNEKVQFYAVLLSQLLLYSVLPTIYVIDINVLKIFHSLFITLGAFFIKVFILDAFIILSKLKIEQLIHGKKIKTYY